MVSRLIAVKPEILGPDGIHNDQENITRAGRSRGQRGLGQRFRRALALTRDERSHSGDDQQDRQAKPGQPLKTPRMVRQPSTDRACRTDRQKKRGQSVKRRSE